MVVLRPRLRGGRRGWGFTRGRLPDVLLDSAVMRKEGQKKDNGG